MDPFKVCGLSLNTWCNTLCFRRARFLGQTNLVLKFRTPRRSTVEPPCLQGAVTCVHRFPRWSHHEYTFAVTCVHRVRVHRVPATMTTLRSYMCPSFSTVEPPWIHLPSCMCPSCSTVEPSWIHLPSYMCPSCSMVEPPWIYLRSYMCPTCSTVEPPWIHPSC